MSDTDQVQERQNEFAAQLELVIFQSGLPAAALFAEITDTVVADGRAKAVAIVTVEQIEPIASLLFYALPDEGMADTWEQLLAILGRCGLHVGHPAIPQSALMSLMH